MPIQLCTSQLYNKITQRVVVANSLFFERKMLAVARKHSVPENQITAFIVNTEDSSNIVKIGIAYCTPPGLPHHIKYISLDFRHLKNNLWSSRDIFNQFLNTQFSQLCQAINDNNHIINLYSDILDKLLQTDDLELNFYDALSINILRYKEFFSANQTYLEKIFLLFRNSNLPKRKFRKEYNGITYIFYLINMFSSQTGERQFHIMLGDEIGRGTYGIIIPLLPINLVTKNGFTVMQLNFSKLEVVKKFIDPDDFYSDPNPPHQKHFTLAGKREVANAFRIVFERELQYYQKTSKKRKQLHAYVSLPYIPASNLESLLKEKILNFQTKVELATDIVKNLAKLHEQKLIHCDLKTNNIRVYFDNGRARARLIDVDLVVKADTLFNSYQYNSSHMFEYPHIDLHIFDACPHKIQCSFDIYSLSIVLFNLFLFPSFNSCNLLHLKPRTSEPTFLLVEKVINYFDSIIMPKLKQACEIATNQETINIKIQKILCKLLPSMYQLDASKRPSASLILACLQEILTLLTGTDTQDFENPNLPDFTIRDLEWNI